MTAGRPHVADDLPVGEVGRDVLAPTAPTASAAPLDVEAVAPPARVSLRWLAVAAIGAAGVGVLASAVAHPGTIVWSADESLHAWALGHRGTADAWFARAVTWGGATTVALPALIVVGAVAGPGRRGLRNRIGAGMILGASAALGVWLGLALNHQVDRGRPPAADWWGAAGGPAFPSGHTTTATIVAGLGAWALSARTPSARGRAVIWTGAVAYALLVGWSRYWLGVHWPSDVVGGWLLGLSWVALVTTAATIVRRRSSRDRAVPPAT